MRDLNKSELTFVSGGGCYTPPPACPPTPTCPPTRGKRNNGFGNGADADRSAPGGSGKTGGGKEGSTGIPGQGPGNGER